jgi:hypothetical protein
VIHLKTQFLWFIVLLTKVLISSRSRYSEVLISSRSRYSDLSVIVIKLTEISIPRGLRAAVVEQQAIMNRCMFFEDAAEVTYSTN